MDLILADNLGLEIWEDSDIPNTTSPIWILGKRYSYEEINEIRADISSIIWFTYRKGFKDPLGSPQYTSDKGFGCMLRTGQMLLAEALKQIHLGREWRWKREARDEKYLKILSRFEDNKSAVFGIHQIALMGVDSGKKISEWYSPSIISHVLKKLVRFDQNFTNLEVHVALDSCLASEEVLEDPANFQPHLIIVPLRLGLDQLNPIYIESLKKFFKMKFSLGIIGGRPNQALYFFGFVNEEILFLDPHTVQRSGTVGKKETEAEIEHDETHHQTCSGRMPFTSMDPSIAVAFLVKSKEDFGELIEQLEEKDDSTTPLFEVIKSRAQPWVSASSSMSSSRDLEHDLNVICGDQHVEDFEEVIKEEGSDDEFEIIE